MPAIYSAYSHENAIGQALPNKSPKAHTKRTHQDKKNFLEKFKTVSLGFMLFC